tara:strand:+ start:2117 stop:3469 length:1353 start_codon:yes stop_codon:yes gene_type:complete
MREYFNNIYTGVLSFLEGLSLTFKHLKNKEDLVATLQYPNEKWPIPDRNIGFDNSEYNVIRSRLHVDMDDCIGCLQCERACPVDCIKIDTIKPPKDSEFDCGTTSMGTQKKLVVPRFTIDMSECMYCNLCVYPCPEECIYMVGGPNEDKHEIDYEFSKYSRDGLIFEFANATDEDILSVGGKDYIEKRESKKNKLVEGEKLQGVEEKNEEDISKEKLAKKAKKTALNKPDYSIINEIEDRMTRGIAKKAYTKKFKENAPFPEIAQFVKDSLVEAEKYSEEFDSIISRISSMVIENNVDSLDSSSSATMELSAKSFNDLTDKMQRGLIKKIFIAEKKKSGSDIEILKTIRKELKEADKLDDEATQLLKSLILACTKKPDSKPENSGLFDLKLLNSIEDKMIRGLSKKIYIQGKKAKKTSLEVLADIEQELNKTDKFNEDIKNIFTSIKDSI